METGLSIRVRGQVQGVGFRPFIWRLAQEFSVTGQVLNDAEGVLIEAWGETLQGFLTAIQAEAPELAVISALESAPLSGKPPSDFRISASGDRGAETRVTPDAATCPDCLAEISGEGRRKGYAFTNCTNCGPRFSIVEGLPYDRAQTTMAGFAICAACRAEYENPADRRFHAQPIACPDCGPRLFFEIDGEEQGGDPLALAITMLKAGGIVAVKGLGGFHLACDAANIEALRLLRTRKHRPAKPFALMGREDDLAEIARIGEAELALLRDPAAPVVLAPSKDVLPEEVAPGMKNLGIMLPHSPLHHLLTEGFGGVLVMTSGNLSGEPQVIGNEEARQKLSGFADGFLLHDRPIARRLDDGVERADPPMVLRRGRGRAPGTFPVPPGFPPAQVLAMGAQMKSAICLVKNGEALLSHHLGELDDALAAEEFDKALRDYQALFDHQPEAVVADLHPGYRSTRAAEESGLPLIQVQHHHAHMAACLGEHLWPLGAGKVAAIVLDGLGLGEDDAIRGGEVLLGDYKGFTRNASLRPAPLAGGDAASRQPWRNALMRLDQAGLQDFADELFAGKPLAPLRAAAERGMNAPLSTSLGRLFDAVAAIIGLTPDQQSYEGEAAMRLEAIAAPPGEAYPFGGNLDPAPMIRALVDDLRQSIDPALISARFHDGLAAAFAAPARAVVESGEATAVVLSGGCFQNARLTLAMKQALEGMPVLTHSRIPANDGGLAFGQALIALAGMTTD